LCGKIPSKNITDAYDYNNVAIHNKTKPYPRTPQKTKETQRVYTHSTPDTVMSLVHLDFTENLTRPTELESETEQCPDVLTIIAWVLGAIIMLLYAMLVVYLAFAMFTLNRLALFFVVLIGSFICPFILPAIILILLSTGTIVERVDTVSSVS
jgi:hypothetical protein